MPYLYRCEECRASSPPERSREDAETARDEHRLLVHGGLRPDGDGVERVPGDLRDPDARYVSTPAVLGLLGALAVVSVVARGFGH